MKVLLLVLFCLQFVCGDEVSMYNSPLIKHTSDDLLVVNVALLSRMLESSPHALRGVIARQDENTLRQLLTVLDTVTGLSANCAMDLATYLQTIIQLINEPKSTCAAGSEDCELDNLSHMTDRYGWLFKVLDASGKPGSAVQHGNVLLPGRYSLCQSIDAQVSRPFPANHLNRQRHWKGQYCRTRMYIGTNPLTSASNVTSHSAAEKAMSCFKILPILNYGSCMPKSCATRDVQKLVDLVALNLQREGVPICEHPVVCEDIQRKYIRDDPWSLFIIAFILLLVVTAAFGSLYDWFIFRRLAHTTDTNSIPTAKYDSQPIAGKILLSFSVFTNTNKIMGTLVRPGDITCLHGIRFLSMCWVIYSHTYYYSTMSITVENLLHTIQQFPKSIISQVVMNGSLAVDTFFFLSGFLVSLLWFKRTYKLKGKNITQGSHWFSYLYHRYLRLTPAYMFILGFHITVLEYVTEGPFWEPLERERCAKSWWSNALYINNFIHLSDEETCMGWTWYLANDFQFYLFMPILMITLYKSKWLGYILGTAVLIASGVLHVMLTLPKEWPPAPLLTADISRATFILDYWPEVYVKPYIRCGPYVVGAMIAHFLWKTKSNVKMSKTFVYIGWTINTIIGLLAVFGLFDYCRTGKITVVEHVLYALFGRIAWALCLAWIVFACATGHGGPINAFLSWKAFFPLSRITFCAYLIHPILIITYFRSGHSAYRFGTTKDMIGLFIGFTSLAYALSFIVSLLLEQPIGHLELIMQSESRKSKTRRDSKTEMGPRSDSMTRIANESTANVRALAVNQSIEVNQSLLQHIGSNGNSKPTFT